MAGTRRQRRQRTITTAILGLYLASWFPVTSALWPFPKKRFTGNSLIDAGSLGIDKRVIAFGDFNGDQYLDVLCLDSDQQTLSIYLWNHDLFQYTNSASFHHPTKVINVVPGDYTNDGKLDLLVMGQGSSNQLNLLLYPASPSGGFDFNHPISVPSSTTAQPISIDIDGDMKIDMLGITPTSQSDSQAPLQVWKNVWDPSQSSSPLFEIGPPEFHGSQCTIADPHGNAVVDLNGDCLADVFLVCDNGRGSKSFQIWINNKDMGFSLAQQGSLPSDFQSISFADIDRDGTIDMLYTTCSFVSPSTGIGSDCYINIAYNQQLPLCTKTGDDGLRNGVRACRPPTDLCIADPNFKFDLSDNDAFVRFPVSTMFSGTSSPPSLLVSDVSFSPALPLPIKLGDANLDGFPDFLMIIAQGSDRIPYLAFSVPCAKGVAGCSTTGTGRRGWVVAKKGADVLLAIKDARGVSFLDMDEDGSLDILVQRTGSSGQGQTMFVQNNFYFDAFFLKAIVLNGACDNGWCYNANRSEKYHPFGVSYSGASYKYTVLDTSGHRSAAQVGQLPQTSYHALYTPYSFFGLGRTNNYIENLFVGSTIHAQDHFINLEGVVPNSKLVVVPSAREGEAWKRQLFLRPGEWIPWVTVAVVSGTALLAIIVFVLHLNEKREDELERRRASHHINFDAL